MKKIAAAALLFAFGAAHAQVYVEGAFGMTNVDTDCSWAISCDKDDTGIKLVGGYQINPNVAFEVGYVNFGKAKIQDSFFVYGDMDISLKSTAFFAGVAVRGELGSGFGASARLALANVDTKLSASVAGSGSGSESKSTVNALYGLGLDYAVNKNVKVTGAIDFSKTADFDGESGTLRMLSVGVKYDF